MKQFAVMVLTLSIICTSSGLLMALVYDATKGPIAQARRDKKNAAISQVLPPHDNEPATSQVTVDYGGESWTFYVARNAGDYVGAACESVSSDGYGGDIRVMVGLAADDTVNHVVILGHKETPGLGARIAEDAFRNRFSGKSIVDTQWSVAKDGGDIDGITAATISSRAVIGAVRDAAAVVYMTNRDTISGADTQQ